MLRSHFSPTKPENNFVSSRYDVEIPHMEVDKKTITTKKIQWDYVNRIYPSTADSDFDVNKPDEAVHLFNKLGEAVHLFHLLQAAEHLKIRNLTDVIFRKLVNMARAKISGEEFDINQAFSAKSLKGAHSSQVMLPVSDHKGSFNSIDSLLRSRGKETFIRKSDFVELQASPFVTSELETLFYRKESVFNAYVNKLFNPKFLIKDINNDLFMYLCFVEELLTEDQSLADQLRFDVVVRLVEILSVIDSAPIKRLCVIILSHARSDECSDVMKDKALPLFVKLMDSDHRKLMVEAVIVALTGLAYARPDYVHAIIKNNALGAVQKIYGLYWGDVSVMDELAKFMVAVCRGQSFSTETFTSDEVDATLTILDNLLQEKINYWLVGEALAILDNLCQPKIKSISRVVRACHALSYLSFESIVPIGKGALKRLIGLTFHADYSVAGSALGVVGNIARWGSDDQIQYLAKCTKLLQSIGQRWLCCEYKLFQMEACQIISNIAARSETFRKNMVKHSLMNTLCRLLEDGDEPDVKMEVAWSLFNNIYGGKYFETIDKYRELVLDMDRNLAADVCNSISGGKIF